MAEWLSLSGQTSGGGPSRVELVGQRLIEHEVWYGLGLGGIEGRSLIQEVTLGRRAAGEMGGGLWGSSRCTRIAVTTGGSVRKARILMAGRRRIAPPEREDGHLRTMGVAVTARTRAPQASIRSHGAIGRRRCCFR